jgi:hypothetical protein
MQKGTHLECAYRARSVCDLRDLDGMAIAFTRIERRDQPLIQRRESDLRVNSSAPHVKRTARLPSPVKFYKRKSQEKHFTLRRKFSDCPASLIERGCFLLSAP